MRVGESVEHAAKVDVMGVVQRPYHEWSINLGGSVSAPRCKSFKVVDGRGGPQKRRKARKVDARRGEDEE